MYFHGHTYNGFLEANDQFYAIKWIFHCFQYANGKKWCFAIFISVLDHNDVQFLA